MRWRFKTLGILAWFTGEIQAEAEHSETVFLHYKKGF
jgi:hypothetical protein